MNRIQAYDGLKGFSIIAIILYHLWPQYMPGGFLTVNLFLILAGYFMARKTATFDSRNLYKQVKRYATNTLRRLWFPLLWFLILLVIILLLINPLLLKSLRNDFLASLFFANNFYQLASERSYFTEMAVASPVTHLWYVAVHVQSFLISLPLLLLTHKWKIRDEFKAFFWLIIFGLCVYINFSQYQFGQDPSNVYYGILTRYASYAAGIAAYFIIPSLDRIFDNDIGKWRQFNYILFAFIPFSLMLALTFTVNDQAPATYMLWLPYYNILGILFIYGASKKVPFIEKIVGNKLFAWIGKKTYSIYLWYYPITVFAFSYTRQFQGRIDLLKLLAVLGILLAGIVFYYLIEADRLYIFIGSRTNLKDKLKPRTFAALRLVRILVFLPLVAFFIYGLVYSDNQKPLALFELEYGLYKAQPSAFNAYYPLETKMQATKSYLRELDHTMNTHFIEPIDEDSYVDQAIQMEPLVTQQAGFEVLSEADQEMLAAIEFDNPEIMDLLTTEEILFAANTPATLFGDSLALLNGPSFESLFRQSNTYGYASLQIWDSFDEFEFLLDQGVINDYLVINMGTNAGLDVPALNQLVEMAGDREIYLINTNSAVEHVEEVNEVIQQVAQTHDNVYEVDWYTTALGHPEYYAADDIHLSLLGMDYYVALLVQKMYEN